MIQEFQASYALGNPIGHSSINPLLGK
jgi:hypothetical protein